MQRLGTREMNGSNGMSITLRPPSRVRILCGVDAEGLPTFNEILGRQCNSFSWGHGFRFFVKSQYIQINRFEN